MTQNLVDEMYNKLANDTFRKHNSKHNSYKMEQMQKYISVKI